MKTLSLGVALFQNKAVLTNYRPLKLVDLIRLGLVNGLAIYDANSYCWGQKASLPACPSSSSHCCAQCVWLMAGAQPSPDNAGQI